MVDGEQSGPLSTLRGLGRRRVEIDRIERDAIDAARAGGASWAVIADALGLASRQAAEQRRLRLDDVVAGRDPGPARERRAGRRRADASLGSAVRDLRIAVTALRADLDVERGSGPEASVLHLARRTADLAVDADAGPLVDLARHLVADLRAVWGGSGDLARSLARVEERLDALRK